jgi:hypothetical protein
MTAVLTAQIVYRGEGAQVPARALRPASEHDEGLRALMEELQGIAAGSINGRVSVRADSSTGSAATRTLTFVQADLTAGDTFTIRVPSGKDFKFTAVASGPTAASGEFSIETSDTAVATSVVAAMAALPGFADYWTAASAAGVVTITATDSGAQGLVNYNYTSVETTATAIVEAAGVTPGDPNSAPAATVTMVHANVGEDDTISIGSVTLTWKASPSGEDQLDIKTTDATDATELARGINAHSKLAGLVSASVAAAVVTVTWIGGDCRAGELVTLATSDATAHTLSGAFLDNNLTNANANVSRTYEQGGAP